LIPIVSMLQGRITLPMRFLREAFHMKDPLNMCRRENIQVALEQAKGVLRNGTSKIRTMLIMDQILMHLTEL
jgi:hypothetical protein